MSELGQYHHAEDAPDKTKKMVAWVAIVLIVAGIGVYVFESGMLNPAPTSKAQTYPRGL